MDGFEKRAFMILSNPEEDQERLLKRELLSLGSEEAKAFREAYSKCSTIVATRKRFDEAVAAADDPNYQLFSIHRCRYLGQKSGFLHRVRILIPMDLPVRPPIPRWIREEDRDLEVGAIEVEVIEATGVEVEVIEVIEVIEAIEATGATGATGATEVVVRTQIHTGEITIIVNNEHPLFAIATLFFLFVPHSPPTKQWATIKRRFLSFNA